MIPKAVAAKYDEFAQNLLDAHIEPLRELLSDEKSNVHYFNFFSGKELWRHVRSGLELGDALENFEATLSGIRLALKAIAHSSMRDVLIQAEEQQLCGSDRLRAFLAELKKLYIEESFADRSLAAAYLEHIYCDVMVSPLAMASDVGGLDVNEFLNSTYHLIGHDDLVYPHYYLNLCRLGHYEFQLYRRKVIGNEQLFVTYDGQRWQVVGVSRLGDLLMTKDTKVDAQYTNRVWLNLSKFTDWSKTP